MEIKNNLSFLQTESRHLKKLKKIHESVINNYENNIFPSTIEKYYQNLLSLIFIQTIDNKGKNQKNINIIKKLELDHELYTIDKSKTLLGSYYQVISDFFISLRKNEKVILYIIQNTKNEDQKILINYISLLFYENVFDLDNNNNSNDSSNISQLFNMPYEIILNKILEELIEKELEEINKNGSNYSKFLDNTLASKIIKNLLKKDDVQKYLRDIFSDIINDIIEMDNKNVFMEPNRIRDSLGQKNKIEDFLNLSPQERGKEKEKGTFLGKIKNLTNRTVMNDENIGKNNDLLRTSFLGKSKLNSSNILNNSLNYNTENDIIKKSTAYNLTKPSSNLYTLDNISKLLYKDLTHSRLIYDLKKQKIYFNEDEKGDIANSYYKQINLDDYLEMKERNPEINNDYFKNDLTQKGLKSKIQTCKDDEYMEEFYNNQLKELQKDPNKSYLNTNFIYLLKKNYLSCLEELIPQYKKNFEKIKYFIDKMIYKMLQYKNEKIPICIRNIVYIICNYLLNKHNNLSQIEVNRYICEFFIGKIIIPFLTNEELINLILGKKIDLESKTFLFYLAKIIKKIFRSNFYDSFEQHLTIFNVYLCEIIPHINTIILNLFLGYNEPKNNIEVKNHQKNINEEKYKSTKIIKYDSIVINEKILNIILEVLVQNSSNDDIIQKLLSSDNELNEYFKLISNNYNFIISQITQNSEILNKKDNISPIDNSFGGPFFIITKEEISKPNINILSLSTNNQKLIHSEVLPKIKYSLIKIFELIPPNFLNKYFKLNNNKTIIQLFSEIKNIYNTNYISDVLNDNNLTEYNNQISLVWYIDYCLNYMNYLSDEYKCNDFKNLFDEIKKDIENEKALYQNDLSEYAFNVIIDNINEKIEFTNNLFNYYSKNAFLIKVYNYLFNSVKVSIDIYEYIKIDKIFLYYNKLNIKDSKECYFLKNNSLVKVSEFIRYISNHIVNEQILSNFAELEKNSKKNSNQINNINSFVEEYINTIKKNIMEESKQQTDIKNNNLDVSINNSEEIEDTEKERIDAIMNIIEELIHEGIYKRIWKNEKTLEDILLKEKCENEEKTITPSIIGINEKYINEHIWQNIQNIMKTKYNIDKYKTPMTKIKCVENIYKLLNKSINVITNKTDAYSVDDIFPIFVYSLVKIKPEYLFTNLNFIKLLISKKNLIKSSGFALTQLEMAVNYLQNLSSNE